jgi:DNA repair protein RadC
MIIREAKLTYKKVGELADVAALDQPEKVWRFLSDVWDEYADQEQFIVIALNRKNKPINGGWIRVTVGTATASLVHPREVFRPILMAGATAFICAHNHPSGDPNPSQADIRVTRQLREAASTLQLDFLDHVVCGDKSDDPYGQGYYSFAESGLL